jgi:hypothetical protein
MDLIDEISDEVKVVKAAHPRCTYQVTCSADVLQQIRAAAVTRNPWLSGQGFPLVRVPAIGTPLVVDPAMADNTFRVDWSPK